jgi:beta-N-acetylhexosaminidase
MRFIGIAFILIITACAANPPETADFLQTQPDSPIQIEAPTPKPTVIPEPGSVIKPEEEKTDPIEEAIRQMTVREKIGQLIIARLPGRAVDINADTKRLIEELNIGGFILFGENVESIEQVRALTADLQALSAAPLFIAIDEEGGRVSRLGKLYEEKIPPMLRVGESGNPQLAYEISKTIGGRLVELGINMNFAPVADIWSNEKNTVIGDRAFGKDAETAATMVEAAVRGFKDSGVLPVLKHFPGHGDTAEDSHKQIAVYHHDKTRFDAVEALPFKRGIASGADGVMTGHIATPLLQGEKPVLGWMEPWHTEGRLPATFSDYWIRDILRGEMGFGGLIITDALEMGALTNNFHAGDVAVGAFLAGADILLIPVDPWAAAEALTEAYESGLISEERLNESVRRIITAKESL